MEVLRFFGTLATAIVTSRLRYDVFFVIFDVSGKKWSQVRDLPKVLVSKYLLL